MDLFARSASSPETIRMERIIRLVAFMVSWW